jgi:tetratricopeptide (TPR) repeat protein
MGQLPEARRTYEAAKKKYEAGAYTEAIPLFRKAVELSPEAYRAKGNYHIGLSQARLGRCTEALTAYRAAWAADSVAGGASSPDKFRAKLAECGYTLQNLTGTAPTAPLKQQEIPVAAPSGPGSPPEMPEVAVGKPRNYWPYLLFGGFVCVLLGIGGYQVYAAAQHRKLQRLAEQQSNEEQLRQELDRIHDTLFNDNLWARLHQTFEAAIVEYKQQQLQLEYAAVRSAPTLSAIQHLKELCYRLEHQPSTVLDQP